MVQRTKKEFKEYNAFRDLPFGLKWGTAFALDDLMKGVRANEAYALKQPTAKQQLTREEIDRLLSDSYLKKQEVTIQLNLLDEFGRLVDELTGYFKGEAYHDYFVFNDQAIYWEDVRHVELKQATKWFDTNLFSESTAKQDHRKEAATIELEKDEFYQPFYEEEGESD